MFGGCAAAEGLLWLLSVLRRGAHTASLFGSLVEENSSADGFVAFDAKKRSFVSTLDRSSTLLVSGSFSAPGLDTVHTSRVRKKTRVRR